MHLDEYLGVKNLTYKQYCDYLQEKYGIPKRPYMTKNWNKTTGNSRTLEGLVIHHKYEDSAIMLSTKDYAMWHPYEWQMPENLIYCDYLEHLLLHVLICMYPAARPEDSGEIVGIGGVENYIVPELNDVYSGFKSKQAWRSIMVPKINTKIWTNFNESDILSIIKREDSTSCPNNAEHSVPSSRRIS